MNHFFSENFIFHESDIKSSHFYDHFTKLDKEYYQIESIRGILSPTRTGSIVFTKLSHGIMLENVVVTFSFNQKDGEIVINFPESELFQGKANKIRNTTKLASKIRILQIRFLAQVRSKQSYC